MRGWRAAYHGLVPAALLDSLSIERREQGWRERLAAQRAPSITLVAELDGAVAGFCSVLAPTRDEDAAPWTAEIAALYVDPERWRGGLGRALVSAALDELERDGWRRATLWVLARNDGAVAFYRRLGFEPDGAMEDDPSLDATEVRPMRAGL